jgi:hypothetical protein
MNQNELLVRFVGNVCNYIEFHDVCHRTRTSRHRRSIVLSSNIDIVRINVIDSNVNLTYHDEADRYLLDNNKLGNNIHGCNTFVSCLSIEQRSYLDL